MKGDELAKLYDTLTVDELFRLRLKAWSRRDNADCDRLDRAALMRQYGAYCSRLEASEVLTLSVIAELLPKLAKLQMVGALAPMVGFLEGAAEDAAWMGYLDGYAAGWKAAGKRGEPPEVADDDLTAAAGRAYRLERRCSQVLNGLASEMASKARTPRDALAAFAADDLGVGLDDLMGAWARPALDALAAHTDALEAAEADGKGVELLRDVLRVAWRRHGLQDATAEIDDELRERYEQSLREADGGVAGH
jgi:hypothetical protein